MLILAESMGQLRLRELMAVYEESLSQAASRHRDLPLGLALEQEEQSFRQYLREVFFRTPGAVLAAWQHQGRYVSVLRLEPFRDGLLIAGLETTPACRRKGYAVNLLSQVVSTLAERGPVKIYSHVDKKNTASLKTHERCGFRRISDCAVFLDGSVSHRSLTLCYET